MNTIKQQAFPTLRDCFLVMNHQMDSPHWTVPIVTKVKNGALLEPPQVTTEPAGAYDHDTSAEGSVDEPSGAHA